MNCSAIRVRSGVNTRPLRPRRGLPFTTGRCSTLMVKGFLAVLRRGMLCHKPQGFVPALSTRCAAKQMFRQPISRSPVLVT